jgi:hypothetical protein
MTLKHDDISIGDRVHCVPLNEPCTITYKDERSIVVQPLIAKSDPRVRSTHLLHCQGIYYGLLCWGDFVKSERLIDKLNQAPEYRR